MVFKLFIKQQIWKLAWTKKMVNLDGLSLAVVMMLVLVIKVVVKTTIDCCPLRAASEKAMAPTPVLTPGKSHGRRSLVGCSPWGR